MDWSCGLGLWAWVWFIGEVGGSGVSEVGGWGRGRIRVGWGVEGWMLGGRVNIM